MKLRIYRRISVVYKKTNIDHTMTIFEQCYNLSNEKIHYTYDDDCKKRDCL